MFNPYSAFPRQTTFTPFVGHNVQRGAARAVNAPDFGAVGTGRSYAQPPLTSAIFNNARNAASIAQGAPGGVAQFRSLQQRPSTLNALHSAATSRGASARSSAFSAARPGSPLANEVAARGAQVIGSDASPLSVEWDWKSSPRLQGYRPNEPWDELLDPAREPRFDPGGRLDAPFATAAPGGTARTPALNRRPQVSTVGGDVKVKKNQRGVSPEGFERVRSQLFENYPS